MISKWANKNLDKSNCENVALLLQSIVGSLLYYSRAVDPSMLPGLNGISTQQADPTINTQSKVNDLLDYVATHSNAAIRFHVCNMCLYIDSDTAFLVLPKARSRLAKHFFLSDLPHPNCPIRPNGPILTKCKTIHSVVASAVEADPMASFIMPKQHFPFALSFTKWATRNHRRHSRLTTRLQKPSSNRRCNTRNLNPGTCVSGG